MGFWPLSKYSDYVRTHAQGIDQVYLFVPYEEPLDGDHPSISLAYHAMPRWMDRFDVDFNESSLHFRRNLHSYRVASEKYIGEVRAQFEWIKSPQMGKALLRELGRTKYRVRIIPYWDYAHPDADAAPWDGFKETSGGLAVWIAATAKGAPGFVDDGAGRPVIGTGGGTNSQVRYTPSLYHASDGPGRAPDEVLFHELVHASRIMRGAFFPMPVNERYDQLEDYLAIILTNIYLSEKGQDVFRGAHRGGILRGADADNFLHNSQRVDVPPTMVIQKFKDTQPEFYWDVVDVNRLARRPPNYNWVRQYDQEAQKLANQSRKPAKPQP